MVHWAEGMTEGYYWIRFNGLLQIAYYTDGETEDLETGEILKGGWQLTLEHFDICHSDEVVVIYGPLITTGNVR